MISRMQFNLDWINDLSAYIAQLNVSVTGLIAAAVIFCLAFLFAIREAASWFFKVDDLKRDLRKLHQLTMELEKEIRSLQSSLKAVQNQETQAIAAEMKEAAQSPKPGGFPISH